VFPSLAILVTALSIDFLGGALRNLMHVREPENIQPP